MLWSKCSRNYFFRVHLGSIVQIDEDHILWQYHISCWSKRVGRKSLILSDGRRRRFFPIIFRNCMLTALSSFFIFYRFFSRKILIIAFRKSTLGPFATLMFVMLILEKCIKSNSKNTSCKNRDFACFFSASFFELPFKQAVSSHFLKMQTANFFRNYILSRDLIGHPRWFHTN